MDIPPGASYVKGNLWAGGIWICGLLGWPPSFLRHPACTDPSSTRVSLQEIHRRFRRGGRSYRGKMKLRRSGVDGGERQGRTQGLRVL